MDSVKTNTLPPEINRCNVIYKGQEYYSKSNDPQSTTTYDYDNTDYYYGYITSSILITIIFIISIIFTIKKHKQQKSIILNVIIITILGVLILSSTASIFMSDFIFKYVGVPQDLTRPCYSTKSNMILYTDEQLNAIYGESGNY